MARGQIITSLIDTDLYKLTMLNVYRLKFANYMGSYEYKCRSDHNLLPYIEEIRHEIDQACDVTFSEDELTYLNGLKYFDVSFIKYLRGFKLNKYNVMVINDNGKLSISVEGLITHVTLFEIIILKIVSEVYTRNNLSNESYHENAMEVLREKVESLNLELRNPRYSFTPFKFSDFGTRRAFSGAHHKNVVGYLKDNLPPDVFNGTSNVKLAMEYNMPPVGTHAHEYQSFFQAIAHPLDSVRLALETWDDVYRGKLAIALTDTLTTKHFLSVFDKSLADRYAGVRHDSGDPEEFIHSIVRHYKNIGIDPSTKLIVFSDGLDFPTALQLYKISIESGIQATFGIGTYLTFDVLGIPPVQSVMKLTRVGKDSWCGDNFRPVCKISDNPIKAVGGDEQYLNYIKGMVQ
jgi:nicotinate phosphoribosyltransferase